MESTGTEVLKCWISRQHNQCILARSEGGFHGFNRTPPPSVSQNQETQHESIKNDTTRCKSRVQKCIKTRLQSLCRGLTGGAYSIPPDSLAQLMEWSGGRAESQTTLWKSLATGLVLMISVLIAVHVTVMTGP